MLERAYAFSPAGSRAPRWPSVWYPLHEGQGSSLAERLNAGPPLQVQGGALVASGRYGSIRFNPGGSTGSQHARTVRKGSALQPIFSLADMAGQHLLLGMELEAETGVSAGGLLGWGQVGDNATAGGWGLRLGREAQRPLEVVIRGAGSAAAEVNTVIPVMPRGTSSRHAVVVELIGLDTATLSVRVFLRPFAPANADADRDLAEPVSVLGGGTAAPGWDGTCALTLGAQRLGVDTVSDVLSGAWLGNVWAQRRSTVDESLAEQACQDMVDSPREFPPSLRD